MGHDTAALADRGQPDLAMQAHTLAIRVEERVSAAEKRQDRHEAEVRDLRKDMIEAFVRTDTKLERVDKNVNKLVVCAMGTIIVMLVGALGYVVWWVIERAIH